MENNKKRWALPIFCVLIVLLSALAVASLWAQRFYEKTYITIDGVRYHREITSLDLSGQPLGSLEGIEELELQELDLRDTGLTAQRYEQLREQLPLCLILWDPPFQGSFWSVDTESFTVTTLSEEDIAALGYFPKLQSIDASGCRDYAQITALKAQYPNCQVSYLVNIGGVDHAPDTQSLELDAPDASELMERLPFLPNLQTVTLTGTLPGAEELLALTAAFPAVSFSWNVTIFDTVYPSTTTELDFSGMSIESVEEVENGIAYLPHLTKVQMHDCGISNEEMDALNRRHENTQFIWTVDIGPIRVRTDATTLMPAQFNHIISNEEAQNIRYLTELVVLDLGHHQSVQDGSFLQYLTKLQFLLLADCGISDISGVANMKQLKYAELFMTSITDYTPLLECTSLQDLNLYFTQGDPETIAQMTWLKRLWWGLSGMSTAEMGEFQNRLPNTEVNLWHVEATSDGWRQGALYYEMRDLLGLDYME